MMNSNPMVQQMLQSNPQMRQMLQNPDFLRRFADPQTMQAVMQMQQAMSQLQNTFGGYAGPFSLSPPMACTHSD